MFSSMFRDSTHEAVGVLPDWKAISQNIDDALIDIKAKFQKAFAEGKTQELSNKEFIKQDIFLSMWKLLEKKPLSEFVSLDEVDQHYSGLHATLPERIENYCKLPKVRALAEQAQLAEPISSYKVNMLLQVARMYHVLIRVKFQLRHIIHSYSNTPFTPDDCYPMVLAFAQQCELMPDLINDIDVASYRSRYLEAIVQMNHYLIGMFRRFGYGEIDADSLLQPDPQVKGADHELLSFYHGLRQLLPDTNELADLVKQKPNEERNRLLQEAVIKLELARNLMTEFKGKMVSHHFKKMDSLDEECNRLRRGISRLRDDDPYSAFFSDIKLLAKLVINTNPEQGVLGLKIVAQQVMACAGQQSWGARIGMNNGWVDASACIGECYERVKATTNDVFRCFTKAMRLHAQGSEVLARLDNKWLAEVTAIMNDWNQAISDADYVFKESDNLIQNAQGILGRCAESNAQYWKNFIKRHWWKGAILATVLTGGGAAVGTVVIHGSMLASVSLPSLGVILGAAGGAGWGFAQDSKKLPQPDKPEVPQEEQEAHDTARILNTLYESEGAVTRKPANDTVSEEEIIQISLSISSEEEGEESAPSVDVFEPIHLFGHENTIPVYRLE